MEVGREPSRHGSTPRLGHSVDGWAVAWLADRSLLRSRSSVWRVAKVCAEGAFDPSGDPVGELEVEPGEFFGDVFCTAIRDQTYEVVNVGADLLGIVAMRSSDHGNGLQCREGREGRYRDDLVDDHIAIAGGDDDAFRLGGCEREAPGKSVRSSPNWRPRCLTSQRRCCRRSGPCRFRRPFPKYCPLPGGLLVGGTRAPRTMHGR